MEKKIKVLDTDTIKTRMKVLEFSIYVTFFVIWFLIGALAFLTKSLELITFIAVIYFLIALVICVIEYYINYLILEKRRLNTIMILENFRLHEKLDLIITEQEISNIENKNKIIKGVIKRK